MSNDQILLQQGWQQHQAGNLDQAEQTYQQVIDSNPQDADAWVFLGILQFDRGQLRKLGTFEIRNCEALYLS